ncbi:MAG TPA: BON domain-containing protein [Aggregatilineales bacterium]|nr:BON domain-containing protein [Aggregatilineales bacterium]
MLYSGDVGVNRKLQAEAESLLERWITPCYVSSCEHIAVSANDQGEVWLSGLVHDPRIADEATRLVRALAGVHFVLNYVTVKHTGDAIAL